MHGRKRKQKGEVENPVEVTKRAVKVKAYTKLSNAILKLRVAAVAASKDPTMLSVVEKNSLKATAKMASVNPDFYTLWNFRRDILTRQLVPLQDEDVHTHTQRVTEMSAVELELTENALTKRNPKCYYAWHHRKWVISLGFCDLNAELALCARFLERDERNFHCWTYRRCVASELDVSLSDEFQFTEDLIQRNFSNGSAWHQRTRVLGGGGKDATLTMELEKLREAIYTEPDDQSAWMYHRWILSNLLKDQRSEAKDTEIFYKTFMGRLARRNVVGGQRSSDGSEQTVLNTTETKEMKENVVEKENAAAEIQEIFAKEMNMCRELISVEPTCRWPRLQLVHMIDCIGGVHMEEERVALLQSLLKVDPTHAKFYAYQLTTSSS